jgi:protein-S-isoprenylcysteine O-methyltransferase Ste14
MNAYLWVFLVLAGFGAFHSLSARTAVQKACGERAQISAHAFTGLRAAVSFGLIVASLAVLFNWAGSTRALFKPITGIPAILPALFGFWIAGRAFGQVAKAGRLPQFFGFRSSPRLFVFSGSFAICRHPMYCGWLIASWGLLLSKPYLLTAFYNLMLTAVVVFLSLQEERRMLALFGDKYRAYQKQVPLLLPYGFLKPQIRKEGAPRL